MKFRIPFHRVNWATSSFLALTFFAALIGAPLYFIHYGVDPFQVGLFLFYYLATGLSITLGYHRLFAHRAFNAKWPVRLWTLIFGACAFEDSALDWASDHRKHHKHVDEENDPYDISRGFFWAHMGWIFFKLYPRPLENVADLRKDPLVMWQHRYHRVIGLVAGLAVPALIGWAWNGAAGALGGFLIAGITRVVFVQHCTFFINSLCHTMGSRPYCGDTSARDSGIMALLTFGEGYHNYHHSFQHDYRNGVKPWHFDPTKWTIWLLSKLRLVSDLRQVAPEKVLMAEIREARRQGEQQLLMWENTEAFAENCPRFKRACEILDELSAGLSERYEELEKAISNRARISAHVLAQWRAEASEYLAHLAEISQLHPVRA